MHVKSLMDIHVPRINAGMWKLLGRDLQLFFNVCAHTLHVHGASLQRHYKLRWVWLQVWTTQDDWWTIFARTSVTRWFTEFRSCTKKVSCFLATRRRTVKMDRMTQMMTQRSTSSNQAGACYCKSSSLHQGRHWGRVGTHSSSSQRGKFVG